MVRGGQAKGEQKREGGANRKRVDRRWREGWTGKKVGWGKQKMEGGVDRKGRGKELQT